MAVPPNFTAGQVLTAAQMDKIGLWTVYPQTSFSAVNAITRDGIFTADFTNYLLVLTCSGSTTLTINYQERASGSTAATGYFFSGIGGQIGSDAALYFPRANNSTSAPISRNASFGYYQLALNICNPLNASIVTTFAGSVIDSQNFSHSTIGGAHNVAAAYDGFTITTTAGTITGSYAVYGYNIL